MRPAYYPLCDFPDLAELREHWAIMAAELNRLQAPILPLDRIDKTHQQVHAELMQHLEQGGQYGWLKGWGQEGGNRRWLQFPLLLLDRPIEAARDAFPHTLERLGALRGLKICSLARLEPHSFLSTHQHPEVFSEGLLQMHITLAAAEQGNYAYLNVAGQFHQHHAGEGVIFDGSLDHFVVNASSAPRTILYLEFDKARLRRA